MKITRIDCHILLVPSYDVTAASSAQDDLVVEIQTDEGISGIGESDLNPWIGAACIRAPGTHNMGQGLAEMLIGQNPLDAESLWEKLYIGSAMNGRRGAGVHAIGALDMALHDLRGKALGKPCHEFLGGAVKQSITPYASLQPEVSSFTAYRRSVVEWAQRAKSIGFRAAKIELTPCGPYAHNGLHASYAEMTEVIGEVRLAVGAEFTLMVDVQYAFSDASTCLKAIEPWVDFDLFFLETPLLFDDLDGYARLASEQPIPIAAGEFLSTRFEFLDLMDRGKIKVVQPDVGRVGGLTEAKRVVRMAEERGLTVVPHLWKSGISIAAAAHLAATSLNCPFIEFLPDSLCESALRRELVSDELKMVDGRIPLPQLPGLGIEINREALERFRSEAQRVGASLSVC